MKVSLKAYVEARRRSRLNSEALDSEVERLYSCFRDYANSRKGEGVQSFSGVLAEFYSEALELDGADSAVKRSLTRRFKKLMRKHDFSDPKYQRRLDEYI